MFAIPLLNTFLLLSSGAFVTWSHHALIQGDRKNAIVGASICVILAILFTALQEAPFSIADSIFGTVFFASTGLNGFHLITGTIFLSVGLIRMINYHLSANHHLGYESAILYYKSFTI